MLQGSPGPALTVAMAVERVGGAGLLWHASALGHPDVTATPQPASS